jgi:serine/threonine-protein kinase
MSANGLLAYATGAALVGQELIWVNRQGVVTPVDSEWTPTLTFGRPALSPDDRMVAVSVVSGTSKPQLWVKHLDRGPAAKVADVGLQPSWSPDGKSIVFVSDFDIDRVPADGSTLPVPVLTSHSNNVRNGAPAYSPDGKWLIVNHGGTDIFGRRTDGDTALVPLVAGPAVELRGTVSPDGRWLAYQSDETGRSEVYVRPFPDTKISKHQVSTRGGAFPRWSHDGRELLFVDERLDLIAVPVTLSPTFAAGTPRRLFAAADFNPLSFPFDVSHDGRRFLMARPADARSMRADQLVIVQNFFTELKAKVKK